MMKRLLLLIAIVGLLLACVNRANFTPNSSTVFPSRHLDWTEIRIYTDRPAMPFIELGFLQGEFDSGVRTPSQNIDKLKILAAEQGADAIINFSCTPGGLGFGYCQGTAIIFTK
jgi:hypothetical protein